MRLFHVSEEAGIAKFEPRAPKRDDLDQSKRFVWALNEKCLPNFFTPRDCPRIAYHATAKTTPEDIAKFFSSSARHCITIESAWFKIMTQTTLYAYEFNEANFTLQDHCAGYYVSEKTEKPVGVVKMTDLFAELFKRNIEIRLVENLWPFADRVKASSLNWSLCRMANAKPRA